MIGVIARKLFGSSNERRIKSYQPRVAAINALGDLKAAASMIPLQALVSDPDPAVRLAV